MTEDMKKQLTDFMKEQIPLLDFQQMDIMEYSTQEVVLKAPLGPNKNVHQTGYAGALSSMLIISAWLMTKAWVDLHASGSTIVLQSCNVNYLRPVKEDILARALSPPQELWKEAFRRLEEEGKTRIEVKAEAMQHHGKVVLFQGIFYIRQKKTPDPKETGVSRRL